MITVEEAKKNETKLNENFQITLNEKENRLQKALQEILELQQHIQSLELTYEKSEESFKVEVNKLSEQIKMLTEENKEIKLKQK